MGMLRVEAAHLSPDPYIQNHIGTPIALEGTVVTEPDVRESSVRVTLENLVVASTSEHIAGRIMVILPPFTHTAYGERVVVRGTPALPAAFETGPGREFDYPGYLAVSGVSALLERAILHESHTAPWTFVGTIIALKQTYVQGITAALPEPHASLGAGITAGEKRGLGKEVSNDFRAVSLTHIIVLSGYNITIVASALAFLLAGTTPLVRFGAGTLVALFFVAMTGGAAASLRAGIMAIIGMAAQGSGRLYVASRALATALLCMTAWNPLVVAFDPGFQLSILATAGLIWIAPLA
jgi:competence protein ComEC